MSEFICDEFVRRYLLSHNYTKTLAALDAESSSDSLSDCFQPSLIVERINRAISDLDSEALDRIWKSLNDCFGSTLNQQNSERFESLKAYTYKTLLIEAMKTKQIGYVNNFFSTQVAFDLTSSTWTNWTVLPFTKEPQNHQLFARYFVKNWTDVLSISLCNFLCVLFSSLPMFSNSGPSLSASDDNQLSQSRSNLAIVDDFADLPLVRSTK
nr:WD repeat containing protein 91 [Hymenolepis microstoma]